MQREGMNRRGRWSKQVVLAAVAMGGLASAVLSSNARAANKDWVGGAFATWNVPGNWTPAGVPQAGDNAAVIATPGFNKSVTIEHDGSGTLLNSVVIDSTANNAVAAADQFGGYLQATTMNVGSAHVGQYVLHSGTNFATELNVGNLPGSNGLYEQSGGSLVTGTTRIGFSGVGFFRQNAGNNTAGTLSIGGNFASGTYNMFGGTLTTNAVMKVGDGGTGSFNNAGGFVRGNVMEVALGPNSTGTYIQDGGFSGLDVLNSVRVAASTNSNGTLSLNFGTMITPTVTVADFGNGTLLVGGQLNTQTITIGNGAGANGFFRTSGTIGANMTVISKPNSVGVGQQFAGGFLTLRMDVGNDVGSNGRFDMFGGFLSAPTLNVGANGGGGTFNHTGGNVSSGTMLVGQNARYLMSGGTMTVSQMTNIGTFNASAGNGSFGTVLNGAGTMTVSGTATVTANNFRQRFVNMNGGTISIRDRAQGGVGARIEDFSFALQGGKPLGALDIADTGLMVTGTTLAGVTNYVRFGRNNGAWDGTGIISHNARNTVGTTLGILTGQQYRDINGQAATFGGHVVVNSDILVKHTLYGDTDFNGVVNFDDYSRVDSGFNNRNTDWFHGDFDLNGVVNFDDYALIDRAFNEQGAVGLSSHAVPEATSMLSLLALAPTLRRRHRTK